MLELDVTPLFADKLEAWWMSNSVANLGPRAAKITWDHAIEAAHDYPLVTDENAQEVREHFRAYGAWTEAEIDSWDNQCLSALVWQDAAADVREHWEDFVDGEDCEIPEIPESRIFHHEGKFYFQIGG